VEAVAVSSCSQEHGSIKDKENGLSQEVAAVLGVLKKEDEKLLAATRGGQAEGHHTTESEDYEGGGWQSPSWCRS